VNHCGFVEKLLCGKRKLLLKAWKIMNCFICQHSNGGEVRDCERFRERDEDCLIWMEYTTRKLMNETDKMLRGRCCDEEESGRSAST
jgi:hypothetical protein